MSLLNPIDQLIAKAVFETAIDQLAIVAGTLSIAAGPLPPGGTHSMEPMAIEHPNTTDKGLDEILPRERKIIQVLQLESGFLNIWDGLSFVLMSD